MASPCVDQSTIEIAPFRSLTLVSEQASLCPHLAAFFPGVHLLPWWRAPSAEVWAGWGLKPASRAAELAARSAGRRFLRLEDGFLRSVGLGKGGAPLVSIVVDDTGIFYDARLPSRLERLVSASTSPGWLARGAAMRRLVVEHRLSKYNAHPDRPARLGSRQPPRVLIVDQVLGDLSIAGSLSDAATFSRMIATARRERPGAELLIRPHPDVSAGYRRGYLTDPTPGAVVVSDDIDTHAVLDAVDEVWTVSSQIGFEALMRSIPVTTFGVPFYAGYGLTCDRAEGAAARAVLSRRAVSGVGLDSLVAAALVRYARYADPVSQTPLEPEQAIGRLVEMRRARDAAMPAGSDR